MRAGGFFLIFYSPYLVGAMKNLLKHATQLYGIIFPILLHFSLILHLPKIAKTQAQYHPRCQHELVFSK